MSYMEEWQKQQKAMKDADREQKKGAAENLNSYRSKQQAAWQKRQQELKEADRKNREKALESLKKYKGGEHDVKEYQRMIAQYRKQLLEESRSLRAQMAELDGPDVPNEMTEEAWREDVEQHIAEFERMIRDHGFEGFDELDLSSPRSSVSSPFRGTPDARTSEFSVSGSRPYQEHIPEFPEIDSTTNQEPILKPNPTDLPGDVETTTPTIQPLSEVIADETEQAVDIQQSDEKPPATPSRLGTGTDSDKKELETPDATSRATKTVQSSPQNSSNSETGQLQSPPRSVSRLIDLDFSFGIIYPSISPAPTIDACSTAAASIVPVSLEKTLQRTLPSASWDSNLQPVLKSVTLDRHFNQPGAIRYVVRGSVPVHMAINDVPSPIRRQLEEDGDLLIGSDSEDQRWKRVRNGTSPDWESILSHKMGHIR